MRLISPRWRTPSKISDTLSRPPASSAASSNALAASTGVNCKILARRSSSTKAVNPTVAGPEAEGLLTRNLQTGDCRSQMSGRIERESMHQTVYVPKRRTELVSGHRPGIICQLRQRIDDGIGGNVAAAITGCLWIVRRLGNARRLQAWSTRDLMCLLIDGGVIGLAPPPATLDSRFAARRNTTFRRTCTAATKPAATSSKNTVTMSKPLQAVIG